MPALRRGKRWFPPVFAVFPADVLIGYVESFSLADTQMAYDVVIRLAVDVSQLTDVILVRNRDIEDVQELEAEAERQNRR